MPRPPGFRPGYSRPAAQAALKSTLVIWPLASLFIVFNLTDYLLVLIFAAIFILEPELSKGREAGWKALVSTVLGGAFAWLFYWLIVAVPEYHFYIVLTLYTSLVFGMNIFSAKPTAKYYGSAMVALLILVNGSMGADADFSQLFVQRIVLIVLTILYIVFVLKALDCYWPAKHLNPR